LLAGIGFTMSLFITDLAFSDDALIEAAKLGILVASLITGVVGWAILRKASPPR
jgi:NhaA family Na+:H+ antiporter